MAIHIGKKIKEELYRQDMSISTFARKINRSRNVVYDIFERESIDTALLNKIGLILHVDFFSLYSDQKEYRKEGLSFLEQIRSLEKQNEILINEVNYLKKILNLMEKKPKK
ncbi:MAG: hypothetical protein ACJ77K_12470 [Bacteroidia bacterium]